MLGGVLPTCSSILPADECCHMVAIIPSRVSKAEFWYLSEESACVAIYGGVPFFRLFYSYGIFWAYELMEGVVCGRGRGFGRSIKRNGRYVREWRLMHLKGSCVESNTL